MAFEPEFGRGETVYLHTSHGAGSDYFGIAVTDRAVYLPERDWAGLRDPWYTVRHPLSQVRAVTALRLKSVALRTYLAVLFVVMAGLLAWDLERHGGSTRILGGIGLLVSFGFTLPMAIADRPGLRIELDGKTYCWKPLVFSEPERERIRAVLRSVVDAARRAGIEASASFD